MTNERRRYVPWLIAEEGGGKGTLQAAVFGVTCAHRADFRDFQRESVSKNAHFHLIG
jgi:hypothetical protein